MGVQAPRAGLEPSRPLDLGDARAAVSVAAEQLQGLLDDALASVRGHQYMLVNNQ